MKQKTIAEQALEAHKQDVLDLETYGNNTSKRFQKLATNLLAQKIRKSALTKQRVASRLIDAAKQMERDAETLKLVAECYATD